MINKSLQHTLCVPLLALLLVACSQPDNASSAQTPSEPVKKRPNFLLIVADDLGYSDLGVFGGEIGTPNLDQLATSGMQLTNFHTAATCSPTRSMLLTGMDNHRAGLGAMDEAKKLIGIPAEYANSPGYAGHLNNRVATLPEVLRSAGYRTYMSGKWHLGHGEDQSPHARGFDKTFTLLEGGAGHLDAMKVTPFGEHPHALYRKNGQLTDLPDDFYSTEFYTNNLIGYLKEDQKSEQPFFAYLTYTAPHWPLQAPAESIARFKGKYDAGYEAFFTQRLQRQKALGLIDEDQMGQALIAAKAWDELSAEDQKKQARVMEIYAAMVSDLDTYIGQLIQTLKDIGEYENTVIFFMSDNGADHTNLNFVPGFTALKEACCDASLENMGAANSFVFQEAGWARVSGAPSKFFKSYTTEGGILAPAIMSYPMAEKATGRYNEFLSVMDVMPTFLELANIEHPAPHFDGREVLPMKGTSMSALLTGDKSGIHKDDEVMGWELHYHRAIRKGNWKITYSKPPLGDNTWKLYDMSNDPFEHHDLSQQQPEKLAELIQDWEQYVQDNNVYVPDNEVKVMQ